MTRMTRRAALGLAGAGATAIGLAACSPVADSPAPGTAGDEGVQPSPDAAGTPSVATSDVPVGGSLIVATGNSGNPAIAIAQPKAGEFVAHTAVCTHQGCIVAAAGAQLQCPCHRSKFDAFTGKVINGPARLPLDAVTVAVDGDRVGFSL